MTKIARTLSNTFLDGEFKVYGEPPEMDDFNSVVFLLRAGEEIVLTEFNGVNPTKGYIRFTQIVVINGKYNPQFEKDYAIWFNSDDLENIDYEEL